MINMGDVIYLISAMLAVIFVVVLGNTIAGYDNMRKTITCRCGLERVVDAIVVDPADIETIKQTLSAGCPCCRSARNLGNDQASRMSAL